MNEEDKHDEETPDEFIGYNARDIDPSDAFKMIAAFTVAFVFVCTVIGLGIIQVVQLVATPIVKLLNRRKSK